MVEDVLKEYNKEIIAFNKRHERYKIDAFLYLGDFILYVRDNKKDRNEKYVLCEEGIKENKFDIKRILKFIEDSLLMEDICLEKKN